jgi:hypothetical protein
MKKSDLCAKISYKNKTVLLCNYKDKIETTEHCNAIYDATYIRLSFNPAKYPQNWISENANKQGACNKQTSM